VRAHFALTHLIRQTPWSNTVEHSCPSNPGMSPLTCQQNIPIPANQECLRELVLGLFPWWITLPGWREDDQTVANTGKPEISLQNIPISISSSKKVCQWSSTLLQSGNDSEPDCELYLFSMRYSWFARMGMFC
jgi:hypothetical protein